MSEIYRQLVAALEGSLQKQDERGEAVEVFRSLVNQVTLLPEAEELAIVLRGDLAAILRFAAARRTRLPFGGRGSEWLAIASIDGCADRMSTSHKASSSMASAAMPLAELD
ncbi:hypothetical protein [Bradyrhizobium valentinum]|uniref:hypothetical protein n=1 Tax=Bradyrhizobium valentinum TaxID=1518501 RepID=UPI00070EA561|nr:hypothetical protein [Bradyrhizobium valentinum]KRR13839.1 hypothetical protein CQ10_38500 [Bradyrhizobium valentinum]